MRLLCSGYGAETGSDLLAVKLFENMETGEVRTEVTGGIRQGDSPSFSLLHGGFLYTVAELVGEKHAYIYQYSLSEAGIPVPTGKKIFLPGGELCHLYAGEKALYASCYGTGDFFAVDYDLEKILWHRSPGAGVIDVQAVDDGAREACSTQAADASTQKTDVSAQASDASTQKTDVSTQAPDVSAQTEKISPHAHWVSEQDNILYLADLGCDRIYRYELKDGLPEKELEALVLPTGAGSRQPLPETEHGKLLSAQELEGTLRRWENGVCTECVKTSRFDGTNYPGTVCMADEKTAIVCNRGANTLSAFSTDGKLQYLGEWETGNWPRHLLQIPGTDLIVNACNKEGTLVIFAWNGRELIRKGEIALPGASCAVYLSGK